MSAFAWNFDTFEDKKLIEMKSAIQNFAFDFLLWNTNHPKAKPPYWLTICGPSECGKTFLTHQLVRFISQFRIHPAPATVAKQTNRTIISRFYEASHLVHDSIRRGGQDFALAKDSDVLAVDDLGADSAREVTVDILYRLLSWRSAKGELPAKWTLITSNLDPIQIGDQYDPRLASRLRRGINRIVEIPPGFKPFYDRKP